VRLLSLGAGISSAFVIFARRARQSCCRGSPTSDNIRSRYAGLMCDEDMGAGTESDPASSLTIGPVELLGVTASQSLTVVHLAGGVLWFKTYFVHSPLE
jgi:hypothetical protein